MSEDFEVVDFESPEAFEEWTEHGVRVDPALKRLIPPLSEDERKQLEANIIAEGCRDPLVVWDGVLLDGHNRFDICTKHDLPFNTVEAEGVSDEESAREWMLRNQLGRRNLSPSAASDLRGMLMRQESRSPGRPKRDQTDTVSQGRTRERLADELQMAPGTLQRDKAYSEALDALEAVDPEIRQKLHRRDGTLGKALGKRDATQLAKKPVEEQRAILDKIESGEARNYAAARQQVKRETFVEKAKAEPRREKAGRIIVGDARQVLGGMAYQAACVITDPPYGIDTHRTREGGHDYADGEAYAKGLLHEVAAQLAERVKPDAHLYFFSGYTWAWEFKAILAEHFDVQDNPLIWVKSRATMGDRAKGYPNRHEYIWFCRQKGNADRPLLKNADDVLEFAVQNDTSHSAEKPVDLLRFLIEASTVEGELVLDPFAGSGSTGVAATQAGRSFVGVEMDPKWAEVAEARL